MSTSPGYRFLRQIVRNDAMKADPPEIYGTYVLWLNLAMAMGAVTIGFHSSIFSGVVGLPEFMNRFTDGGYNLDWYFSFISNIATMFAMAGFAGALGSIPLADRLGRRPALLVATAVILVGDIMQCAAWGQLVVLHIGRFISGVGVGVCSTVIPIYIAEHSPRAIRGLTIGAYCLAQRLGSWLGTWIVYGTRENITRGSDAQWIMPLAVQALPAVLFIAAISFCPDTPRCLAAKGDKERAHTLLSRVRNLDREHDYIKTELSGIYSQLEEPARETSAIRQLFKIPSNRNRLLIAAGLIIAQSLSGYDSIAYDSSYFFLSGGWTRYERNMYTWVLYGALELVSCIVFSLFVADTLGRRKSLLCAIPAQTVCLFAIGTLSAVWYNMGFSDGEKVFFVELAFIYLCSCVFRLGLGPVPIVYAAEIPSTRMRALTVGLVVALQWLFVMGLGRALPYMLFYIGRGGNGFGTHLIFGVCCIASFFFVRRFVPETKGLSLEDMDRLFGERRTAANVESPPEEGDGGAWSGDDASDAPLAGSSSRSPQQQQQQTKGGASTAVHAP